jgi:hypothetical protein
VLVKVPHLRALTWIAVAAIVLPPLTLLPQGTSSTDLARVRNAMVFDAVPREAFEWTTAKIPAGFMLDDVPPDPYFVEVARRLDLDALTDDWQRAIAISRHLLASQPRLTGGPIQAPLRETHRRIVEGGEGYCADFVRAFQALAAPAGMPLRTWAFSFDGFGGHGHIVVEIWNRQLGRWEMLDLFNNVYFPGADGLPLDAMAVRDGFVRDAAAMVSLPLVAQARPGYKTESKLRDYYVAGLDEWYLWWGNNPFSYENASAVRALTPASRPLAQLGAIAQGVQPHAVGLATASNDGQVSAMRRLTWQVRAVMSLMLLGLVLMCWSALRHLLRRSTRTGRHGH